MKKRCSPVLALALAVVFTACGQNQQPPSSSSSPLPSSSPVEVVPSQAGEPLPYSTTPQWIAKAEAEAAAQEAVGKGPTPRFFNVEGTKQFDGRDYYLIKGTTGTAEQAQVFGWYFTDVETGQTFSTDAEQKELLPLPKAAP